MLTLRGGLSAKLYGERRTHPAVGGGQVTTQRARHIRRGDRARPRLIREIVSGTILVRFRFAGNCYVNDARMFVM